MNPVVQQVVRPPWQWLCIKWPPPLLSVLWFGRCKVAQKSTGWIRAPSKSKKGISSMLQVLQWAFSVSVFMADSVSSRHGEEDNQSCVHGLRIQNPGSRHSPWRGTRREGIGAIWLPSSPGTPGPGHSRTGTAPRTNTDIDQDYFPNQQEIPNCAFSLGWSNLVFGVPIYISFIYIIYICLIVSKSHVQTKTNNDCILFIQAFCRVQPGTSIVDLSSPSVP